MSEELSSAQVEHWRWKNEVHFVVGTQPGATSLDSLWSGATTEGKQSQSQTAVEPLWKECVCVFSLCFIMSKALRKQTQSSFIPFCYQRPPAHWRGRRFTFAWSTVSPCAFHSSPTLEQTALKWLLDLNGNIYHQRSSDVQNSCVLFKENSKAWKDGEVVSGLRCTAAQYTLKMDTCHNDTACVCVCVWLPGSYNVSCTADLIGKLLLYIIEWASKDIMCRLSGPLIRLTCCHDGTKSQSRSVIVL